MDEATRTRYSRTLSMWLRHKPEQGGITLSPEGWARVPDILEAFEKRGMPFSRIELDHLVRLDPKARFELEGDRIRARYGHSLELESKPHPGMPPAALYHGTTRRFLPRILQSGLRPMKRQFVHLSPERAAARDVGARRDESPVLLKVDAHRAFEAGIQFYPRGKGIWLSDPIPAEYLTVLEERPAGEENQSGRSGRAARDSAPGEPRRRKPRGGFFKKRSS